MTSKKLGALLRSVPPATVAEAPEAPVAAPAPAAVEPEYTKKRSVPARRSSPRCRCKFSFRPASASSSRSRRRRRGKSLRALVLGAIRSLGITVTDADIKGKRGRRSA